MVRVKTVFPQARRVDQPKPGGLKLNPKQAQVEWEACYSPRRTYTGINEVVSTNRIWRILFQFFDRLVASRDAMVREVGEMALIFAADGGPRRYYEALMGVIMRDTDFALAWLRYAHEIFPRAPKGFEWVGRMANESRKVSTSPSPRLLELPDPVFFGD